MQDLSGRPHLSFDVDIPSERIGTFDTQLVEHFFQSLANTSGMTLHIRRALFLCLPQLLHIPCHPHTQGTMDKVLAQHAVKLHSVEFHTESMLMLLLCRAGVRVRVQEAGREELPPPCGGDLQGVCEGAQESYGAR